jgi:hypothetical protein
MRQRLRRLDSRVLPGLRQPGETAEVYLRRAIHDRRPGGFAAWADVIQALREHFRDLDAERSTR